MSIEGLRPLKNFSKYFPSLEVSCFLLVVNSLVLTTTDSIDQRNLDTKSITIESFDGDHDAQSAMSLFKFAIDSKNTEFLVAGLALIQRICMKDETQKISLQLGDFGICNMLDQLLGQKSIDLIVSEGCLQTIRVLISDPKIGKMIPSSVDTSPTTSQQQEQSSNNNESNDETVTQSIMKVDNSANRKRFGSSNSLFRIIKTGMTNLDHIPTLLLIEDILRILLIDIGKLYLYISHFI